MQLKMFVLGVLPVLLAACGGGGGSVQDGTAVVRPSVVAGFAGLNAEGEGGSGGGGDGGGGDGGIGAGGSLGAFSNVRFTVTGDNAQPFGSAEVASGSAVTIYPPVDYIGSIRVEIAGTSTSNYYDESLNFNVPTGTASVLRAVVSSTATSIGVTPLTTAAAAGLDAAVSVGSAQANSLSDIAGANRRVQQEVNAFLPADYQFSDITILPVLTNINTVLADLSGTVAGRYAQVLAAVAVAARDFNPSLRRPALSFLENLSLDIADGTIDSRDANGEPIALPDGLAYDVSRLSNDLAAALQVVATPVNPAIGRLPSANLCPEALTDDISIQYEFSRFVFISNALVGFDERLCEYSVNSNGGRIGPNIRYASDFSQASDTTQCSDANEFSVVTNSLSSTFRSSSRLVSVRLESSPNYLPADLALEVLRQAVIEGVGAPCQ